jgi:hypothetical protein
MEIALNYILFDDTQVVSNLLYFIWALLAKMRTWFISKTARYLQKTDDSGRERGLPKQSAPANWKTGLTFSYGGGKAHGD